MTSINGSQSVEQGHPRCNKGEPRFAFAGWTLTILADGGKPLVGLRGVSLVGAEGLEPPTYAL
jgi:hypothetical protein